MSCARCSTAWARTARSAPTRTASRSSRRMPGCYAQGYFVYDSHKSGAQTVSHLRFGPQPIRAPYLIAAASFVGCHQFQLLERVDVLRLAAPGATFLLNMPARAGCRCGITCRAPCSSRSSTKRLRLFVIDASRVAPRGGARRADQHGAADLLLRDLRRAAARARRSTRSSSDPQDLRRQGRRGGARELSPRSTTRWAGCARWRCRRRRPAAWSARRWCRPKAPEFVREVTAAMMEGRGDEMPVSRCRWTARGHRAPRPGRSAISPTRCRCGTQDLCIQCGQCSFVCPQAVIQAKYFDAARLERAPVSFRSAPINVRGFPDVRFTLQFALEDCTGCGLCVEACPVRAGEAALRPCSRQDAVAGGGRRGNRVLCSAAGQRSRACRLRQRARGAVPRAAVRFTPVPAPAAARRRT